MVQKDEAGLAVFAYKASDLKQHPSTGTIVADTPRAARDQLRARGLIVHQINESTTRQRAHWWRRWRAKREQPRINDFLQELATLLEAGIPLLEAIDTLSRQQRGAFHVHLQQLSERLANGASLADAMRASDEYYDELAISIVEVGENAGTLGPSLQQLAEFRQRASQFKSHLLSALMYPMIVLVLATGVSIFLMTFVVPKLLGSLVDNGKAIPLPTRIVKGISDALLQNGLWIALGVTAGVAIFTMAMRTPRAQKLWHRLQLRLPLIGSMVRKQVILRLAVVISTLLRSSIEFVQALRIARNTTSNSIFREALDECERSIRAGREIAEAMGDTQAFPPMVVHLFHVGQQSGQTERMLDRLAKEYDRQLTVASQRLTAVLEPLLILVMVAIVGLIAFATILPMLEATRAL